MANRLPSRDSALATSKAARMQRDLELGLTVINGNTTVEQWAMEWLETYKASSVGQVAYERYKQNIKHYLIDEIGNLRLSDVKPIHLQKILNNLLDFSRDFVSKIRSMYVQVFGRAQQNGILLTNPAQYLELPNQQKTVRTALSQRPSEKQFYKPLKHTVPGFG